MAGNAVKGKKGFQSNAETFAIQVGVYVKTSEDKELLSHFVKCKPHAQNIEGGEFICNCGEHSISLNKIIGLLEMAWLEGGLHLRID